MVKPGDRGSQLTLEGVVMGSIAPTVLRIRDAVAGTNGGHAATRERGDSAWWGGCVGGSRVTEEPVAPLLWTYALTCYAMSGTDMGNAATHSVCDVPSCATHRPGPNAGCTATQCPVLT
eukprot:2591443-Rhodomonas_salina.4